MGRHKDPDRVVKKVNFSLDMESNQRIKELSELEGIGKSAFVEMLILRWDEGINPESKLDSLLKERKKIGFQLETIDSKIKQTGEHITLFNKMKRHKLQKKPMALKIIENKIRVGEIMEAETMAKAWQNRTGTSALELMLEAQRNLEDKGI